MTLVIGSSDDFPEAAMRVLTIDEQQIGVIRWDGQLYAVRNVCPHQSAPLCHGAVRAALRGDRVGQMGVDGVHPVITCPWHGWAFDLSSGLSATGDRGRVRAYSVREEAGRVVLDTRRRRRA